MPKRLNYKQRQAHALAMGLHPLQGEPLHPEPGHTCGDCGHCMRNDWTQKRVYKCDRLPTRSATTDVKLRWPACRHWTPKGEES